MKNTLIRAIFLMMAFALPSLLFAQHASLFAPYDCREHAFQQYFDPQIDTSALAHAIENFHDPLPAAVVIAHEEEAWQNWMTVQNYAYGKDRGNLEMIADLNALHPVFRDKITTLIRQCKAKGITLAVVETYRTPAKQNEYKSMGKKYTRSSGGKSKHQYGLAADIVPIIDSVAVWDNMALWRKIGVMGERLGLRWGGRWRHIFDPGHFEWTGGLSTAQLANGNYPQPPSVHYPCLDEDIRQLQRYWSSWEASQSLITRK